MQEKNGLQAWEMMNEAKEAIGMSALSRIFKVGYQALYKCMRNPEYSGDSARPPFQRVRMLLHDLHTAGATDLAHAMLNYMASALDMHVVPNAVGIPDKDDIAGECLDDYPPLTRLHDAIKDGADVRQVEALAEVVTREVAETVTLYRDKLEG